MIPLPEELVPRPTECSAPWWEAAAAGRLLVQRCTGCEHRQLYPRGHCVRCWATDLELVEASGRGTIHSVTVTRRNPEPAFDPPYSYAIVELEEGPRLTALIRDSGEAELGIGAAVKVRFERATAEIALPVFAPAGAADSGNDLEPAESPASEEHYRSEVALTYRGAEVDAELPLLEHPVRFGLHGVLAEHYGLSSSEFDPTPATLDYLVAAVGSCMVGTFGEALESRRIRFSSLAARASGSVEIERGVLVLKAVTIRYRLVADGKRRAEIERVHEVHAGACPMHRSVSRALAIESELELVAEQ